MTFFRKLIIMAGMVVALNGVAQSNLSKVDNLENKVSVSGRMVFYDGDYLKWMEDGKDRVEVFRDGEVFASTDNVNPYYSHFQNLNLCLESFSDIISGAGNYDIRAFNSETNSYWDTQIMGYNIDDNQLHLNAYSEVPLPSTLLLMGAGAYFLMKRKKV